MLVLNDNLFSTAFPTPGGSIMVRYWAVALLALVPATAGVARAGGKGAEKELVFKGKLTRDDPRDKRRNAPCKVYTVPLKAGSTYTIDMKSREFDSYLFLEDKDGKQLDEDDDSGGNLDARIIFNCTKDGDYKIVCTAFSEQGAGSYTLTVKKSGVAPKNASAHAALVGKAAPDIQAEFAVNGPAVKLSDLKGKVVLLAFWEVTSGPSVATLPRLRDWHKAHKADGLEVVGVTYYHYEVGQKLGFDKAAGKLTKLDKATKETEQEMLKDFAAHHKLEHLLLLLPLADALKTYDTYVVNGLPQFVLIDRAGVIRSIRVGEDANTAAALEGEIKKALAEK
jgi:thiol-disulfide isomerase/thioredoxin